LAWLVNLKAHKDQHGKDELYQHEQPEAWVRAKELLVNRISKTIDNI